MDHLVDAPLPNVFVIAGLIFLAIAIVGKVSGKIDPSLGGRVLSGALGVLLVVSGVYWHSAADPSKATPALSPLPNPVGQAKSTEPTPPLPSPEKQPKEPLSLLPKRPSFKILSDTDLYGSDERCYLLPTASLDVCQQDCAVDRQCRAYTYAQHGTWNGQPGPLCCKKASVPPVEHNNCCVSGVKK